MACLGDDITNKRLCPSRSESTLLAPAPSFLPTTAQGDPFKTLFVSRLGYDITDKRLRKEFEEFGPIASVRIVHDKTGGW